MGPAYKGQSYMVKILLVVVVVVCMYQYVQVPGHARTIELYKPCLHVVHVGTLD